ncbi:MAG TPA: hypothetical protein VJ949_09950, partial [Cryomorphaceae bacterium]|nr:hypothetical protein [Cryomorphaceae bacterium]
MKINRYIFSLVITTAAFAGCTTDERTEQTAEVAVAEIGETDMFSISLADFSASEGEVSAVESHYSCLENCWLEYTVDVPISGRYRIEIEALGLTDSSQVWIEDYVHNKDDRTYNITGNISLEQSKKPSMYSRDGSPLRAGKHDIRLHLVNGVEIHEVDFSLMRKHEETPETLTQNMEGENWEIVWSDEFNGTGLVDTTKW